MSDVELKIKAWWRSATVWLQGTIVTIAALGDMLPFVNDYMPESPLIRWLVGVIAVATIYLRIFSTNQAVSVKAAMKPVTADRVVPPAEQAEIRAK